MALIFSVSLIFMIRLFLLAIAMTTAAPAQVDLWDLPPKAFLEAKRFSNNSLPLFLAQKTVTVLRTFRSTRGYSKTAARL